jgi:hypothetical protein
MDSNSNYSYERGSDPLLSHPDFFEGDVLGGPQRNIGTGFLEHGSNSDSDDDDVSAAASVLYPVGYTKCRRHGLPTTDCPKCFKYLPALKSTGFNCQHLKRKNSCRTCYDAAMDYRKSLKLPPISWGIFCKHGLNRHDTCDNLECKEGIKSRSGRDTNPLQQPQQAVSRFEHSPFASVFPHESDAQVYVNPNDDDVLSMDGGSKSYRKSARKLKKKAKISSRKAKRSSRKAKRSSRSRR